MSSAATVLDSDMARRGYWQRFIDGRVIGATMLITEASTRVLGVTESLSAEDWLGPRPFIYRGSLGPVRLGHKQCETLRALAARIGEQLGYRGYLQADLIEDSDGQLWLLELNPRWTAGMEVLHACVHNLSDSPLAVHLRTLGFAIPSLLKPSLPPPQMLAKAILYAPSTCQLPAEQRSELQLLRQRQSLGDAAWWNIADVPAIGDGSCTTIDAGQPILTIRVGWDLPFASWAQARQTLLDALNVARSRVLQRLFESA